MAPPVAAYYTFMAGSALIGGYMVNHAANNISSKMNQDKAPPPADPSASDDSTSSPAKDSAAAGQAAKQQLAGNTADCGTGNCPPQNNNNNNSNKNKWKGKGAEYEKHVAQQLNADKEDFFSGGRQFDGAYTDANGQTTWYDAKSSWDYTNNPQDLAKFQSTTGQQASIAANNGANFAIVTPVDPPANVQSFLSSKGVPIVKVP